MEEELSLFTHVRALFEHVFMLNTEQFHWCIINTPQNVPFRSIQFSDF